MTDDNPEPLPWETEAWKKEHPGPDFNKTALFPDNRKKHSVEELRAKLLEWAKEDREKTKELTNLFT
jgi:hypothetical protein